MGWQAAAKVLGVLLKLWKGFRFVGGKVLTKVWAVTSRTRLFAVAALYYVVYENWAVLQTGNVERILLHVGHTLLSIDVSVEQQTRAIVTGEAAGFAALSALVAIVGGVTTFLIYLRAARLAIKKLNPNIGLLGVWGAPLVAYGLVVFAASAVQGDPRIPFVGLATLVMNFDQVFDLEVVRAAWLGNGSGPVGDVRSLPNLSLGNQSVVNVTANRSVK